MARITKSQVYWAYHTMLGRYPEADTIAVDWSRSGKSLDDLIDYISTSSEFKQAAAKQAIERAKLSSFFKMRRRPILMALLIVLALVAVEVLAIEYLLNTQPAFREIVRR